MLKKVSLRKIYIKHQRKPRDFSVLTLCQHNVTHIVMDNHNSHLDCEVNYYFIILIIY